MSESGSVNNDNRLEVRNLPKPDNNSVQTPQEQLLFEVEPDGSLSGNVDMFESSASLGDDLGHATFSDMVNQMLFDNLSEYELRENRNKNSITPEVLALFKDGNSEIDFNELVDKYGRLKPGLDIFDLNNDWHLDDVEKTFFASGGHARVGEKNTLTLGMFLDALNAADRFGVDNDVDGLHISDNQFTSFEKNSLHEIITASEYMLENIKTLPKVLQEKYAQALEDVYLGDCKSDSESGSYLNDTISIDTYQMNKDEIASIVIHELTHYLQRQNNLPHILEEVETFYMEYKLYSEAKNNKDYFQPNLREILDDDVTVVDSEYMDYIDKLKSENPDMTEKELAIKAFLKFHFDDYNERYAANMTPEDLEKLANETKGFIYLK